MQSNMQYMKQICKNMFLNIEINVQKQCFKYATMHDKLEYAKCAKIQIKAHKRHLQDNMQENKLKLCKVCSLVLKIKCMEYCAKYAECRESDYAK